jgi:propionyl-CoA carboxylase alpha chain
VEHPVTELITGLDLVELQILVAEGHKLPITQKDVHIKGHAVECRVYAEDPADNFMPSTGKLIRHRMPSGPGIRVDAGVEEGQDVTINYDPMISKLCAFGPDRKTAIRRMLRALDEYEIAGCRTTIPFCSYVLRHEAFRSAAFDTHFVKDHFDPEKLVINTDDEIVALAASLVKAEFNGEMNKNGTAAETINADHGTNWWNKRRA